VIIELDEVDRVRFDFAIEKLAEGAADPRCKKCSGKGTRGLIGKGPEILVCRCAIKGFRPTCRVYHKPFEKLERW